MAEIDTLLAHLSPSFTSQTENIAVEALGYVLNKYAGSREGLDDVVRSGVRNVKPVDRVRTQASALDGTRPDLVGVDEDGAERVLIEAKFWADLTPRQPHAYLDRLPDDGPAVLVFLTPEDRVFSLWPQLRSRAQRAGKTLVDVDAERKCVRVDGSQRHVLLVSWTGLLDRNVRTDERRAGCRRGYPAVERTRRIRGGRTIPAHPRHSRGLRPRLTSHAGHEADDRRCNRTGRQRRMGVSKGFESHSAFVRVRSVLEARRSCRVVWDPHRPMGARWQDPVVARLR